MTSAAVQTYTLDAPWVGPDDLRPDSDCTPCQGVSDTVPDDAVLEAACLAASEYLWAESMFAFGGVTEATVRPCGNQEGFGWGALWAWTAIPFYLPGYWPLWGTGCGSCGANGGCNCCGPEAFSLGVIPIVAISEVKLDGDVLVEGTDYVLIDNLLTKINPDTGAGERWPFSCQDVASSDDDTGTMSVSFTWGVDPPQLGVTAARDLACMLVKEACGGDCGQPSPRMVSKQAGGTVMNFISPDGDITTSLPQSAKMFLKAYGPSIDGVRQPPRMRRPNSGNGFIWNWPMSDLGWQRAGIGSGCNGC